LSAWIAVRQYPYLTLAEVHAALASYFDQPDDIDAELAAEYQDVQRWGGGASDAGPAGPAQGPESDLMSVGRWAGPT